MMSAVFLGLVFTLNILNVLTQPIRTTTTALPPSKSSNTEPSITQILVFASSTETTIEFEPENGWILNDERILHLVISGTNLKNTSLVFTSSSSECKPHDFVSPIYRLPSKDIIELKVKLESVSKAHSTVHICLLPRNKIKNKEKFNTKWNSIN